MYRVLVISALAGAALGGAITPETNASSEQSHEMQLAESLTTLENNSPVYRSSNEQKSPVLSPQFYYPTYPVYPENSDYGVQTRNEGYLTPTEPPRKTSNWPLSMLSSLVPFSNFAISFAARAVVYLWKFLLLLLVGAVLTVSICTFTPLCTTISHLGYGLSRSQVGEQVKELARTYITPESIDVATLLVKKAIDKYAELERQQHEAEEKEKKAKKDAKRRRRR